MKFFCVFMFGSQNLWGNVPVREEVGGAIEWQDAPSSEFQKICFKYMRAVFYNRVFLPWISWCFVVCGILLYFGSAYSEAEAHALHSAVVAAQKVKVENLLEEEVLPYKIAAYGLQGAINADLYETRAPFNFEALNEAFSPLFLTFRKSLYDVEFLFGFDAASIRLTNSSVVHPLGCDHPNDVYKMGIRTNASTCGDPAACQFGAACELPQSSAINSDWYPLIEEESIRKLDSIGKKQPFAFLWYTPELIPKTLGLRFTYSTAFSLLLGFPFVSGSAGSGGFIMTKITVDLERFQERLAKLRGFQGETYVVEENGLLVSASIEARQVAIREGSAGSLGEIYIPFIWDLPYPWASSLSPWPQEGRLEAGGMRIDVFKVFEEAEGEEFDPNLPPPLFVVFVAEAGAYASSALTGVSAAALLFTVLPPCLLLLFHLLQASRKINIQIPQRFRPGGRDSIFA